jgi:hypothetical protein
MNGYEQARPEALQITNHFFLVVPLVTLLIPLANGTKCRARESEVFG